MWEPGRPTFSPDGKVVALTAFKPYSARYREGQSEILTINRETAETAYAPAIPHRSLGTRGDDGPIWSPDGRTGSPWCWAAACTSRRWTPRAS